jgi:hypothetical protein
MGQSRHHFAADGMTLPEHERDLSFLQADCVLVAKEKYLLLHSNGFKVIVGTC